MNKNIPIIGFSCVLFGVLFTNTMMERTPTNNHSWDELYATPKNIQQLQDRLEEKLISEQMDSKYLSVNELFETTTEKSLELRLDKLTKSITTSEIPSENELRVFFESQKEEYRGASTITLQQVVYTINARGGNSISAAQKALLHSESITPRGDEAGLPTHFTDISSLKLDKILGESATQAIINLARYSRELPCWGGPIISSYGAHLVCVKQFKLGEIPPFPEVRTQVLNDWRYEVSSEKDLP